ncbi:MAG: diguanylate cyclase, partial [Dokdonella sp.]
DEATLEIAQPGHVPDAEAAWLAVDVNRRIALPEGSWLRLSIAPLASAQPIYLVIPRRGTGTFTLHGGASPVAEVSDHYRGPFRADLSSRHHLVELPSQLPQGLLVHIHSTGQTARLTIEVLARDVLFSRDPARFLLDTVLSTFLLVLASINLLAGMLLCERVNVTYFACVLVSLASLAGQDASLYTLPVIAMWSAFGQYGIFALIALSLALLIAFAHDFVQVRTHAPNIDRLLLIMQLASTACALGTLLPYDALRPVLNATMSIGYLILPIALLATAALAARAGRHYGRMLLVAFTPHVLTMLVQSFALFGIIDSPDRLYTASPVSIAFEAVICALGLAWVALLLRQQRDEALELVDRDELTQVLGRRALCRKLQKLCAMASDHDISGVALLLIDIDHFKRINEPYAHAVGDECLREVARLIQSELRQGGLLGRHGGEEFVVLLPGSDRENALGIAERVRKRAAATSVSAGTHNLRAHLSIGVAASNGWRAEPAALLRLADAAMYAAKSEGRNRVNATVAHPLDA